MSSTKRAKHYTFILYPESAPENWVEILNDTHIEWVESPLHDKDLDASGVPKKAHKHILLMFSSLKSYEQVKTFVECLNVPSPQVCQSVKGMVRYMAHLDDADKHQYDLEDIVPHGGVDLESMLRVTGTGRYEVIGEILDFIKVQNIVEYQDIMDYARAEKFREWFPLMCDNGVGTIVQGYIRSVRHRKESAVKVNGSVIDVDYSTGEIL